MPCDVETSAVRWVFNSPINHFAGFVENGNRSRPRASIEMRIAHRVFDRVRLPIPKLSVRKVIANQIHTFAIFSVMDFVIKFHSRHAG